ncbi:rnd efflux pump membrane fusion protein barrel-sandwich domain [Lucifera butyrica]|uniref:Rnd efflux pump membrane fusion protein barrel-sandwich domain n=1 Tax=Lucifera butyrica TaxID=1351585 RepID=A0A498R767_9FIRM|nr:efflux RND transporter periplasmic adaptor subunit [Lucifera butyrica]VBB04978.1 rnd efflux pump membrane fusion protein barrel-sandwich domain [Lucifera butyrica]
MQYLPKTPKQKLYYGLTAIAIALGIAGVMVWNGHQQPKAVTEDIPAVQTAVINTTAATQEYTYSGEVRGRYESQLAFQVSGKVIKRYVERGSTVKAGDLLMKIDPKDLQQLVNSNSAQVYSAESNLKLAEANLKRFQQLYQHGVVSKAVLDQYQTAYDVAVAGTRQASAQLSAGVNQLDYSSLYADHSGVISQINVEAGQVVGAGQPVLTIVLDGEREVEISVPENRIEELRKSPKIQVSFWALPNITTEGKVREIAPMADPVTRTYKVRITLLNPSPEIKLGMTASVTLLGNETQAAAIVPLSAIYQTGDTPCVWVVTGETVTLRQVKTGKFGNGTVEIVSGLQQGDRIVTAGVHKLREGQKVNPGGDTL